MFITLRSRESESNIDVNVNNVLYVNDRRFFTEIHMPQTVVRVYESKEEVIKLIEQESKQSTIEAKLDEINNNINEGIGDLMNTINPR